MQKKLSTAGLQTELSTLVPTEKNIKVVVEDNGFSTNTPTHKAWNNKKKISKDIIYYSYKRKYPHHGTGSWVLF